MSVHLGEFTLSQSRKRNNISFLSSVINVLVIARYIYIYIHTSRVGSSTVYMYMYVNVDGVGHPHSIILKLLLPRRLDLLEVLLFSAYSLYYEIT